MSRYPFPVPFGWFQVAWASDGTSRAAAVSEPTSQRFMAASYDGTG